MKKEINFTTIDGIKAWAKSIYEKGGHWIIECWSDEEIKLFIRHRNNGREVRRDLWKYVKEMEEHSAEIAATAF